MGLKCLDRTERAGDLPGQSEKTKVNSRSWVRPRPRPYLPNSIWKFVGFVNPELMNESDFSFEGWVVGGGKTSLSLSTLRK